MSDELMLWGAPVTAWEYRGVLLLWAGGVFGVLALFATVSSSLILLKTSSRTQNALDAKTREHESAIGEQKTKAAEFEKQAQELKGANLAFESAISPRLIEQLRASEALAQFSGVKFVVVSPSDFEPKRMAGQIRFVLLQAKWQRYDEPLSFKTFMFRDGVTVHKMRNISNSDPAEGAIAALIAVLKDNGIEATAGFPIPTLGENGLPAPQMPNAPPLPSVVVIEVGPKPLPPSLRTNPGNRPGMWGNIAE